MKKNRYFFFLMLSTAIIVALELFLSSPISAEERMVGSEQRTRENIFAFYHDKEGSSGSPFGAIMKSIKKKKGQQQKQKAPPPSQTPQLPSQVPQISPSQGMPLPPKGGVPPFGVTVKPSQSPQNQQRIEMQIKQSTGGMGKMRSVDPGVSVESLKKRFLACSNNNDCWVKTQMNAIAEVDSRCGPMAGICAILGRIDVSIVYAIARMEYEYTDSKKGQSGTGDDLKKIPGAKPSRTASLLLDWDKKLEPFISKEVRSQVDKYASNFPKVGDAKPFPLIFVQTGIGGKEKIEPKPTRRDWAYALQGALFAQAGFSSPKYGRLLDLAFWSFLKAAELKKEPEHLSNIAFFLNLIHRYEEARDVLALARELNPNHPDVRGNLAFVMRRLGNDDIADSELKAAVAKEFQSKMDGQEGNLDGGSYKGLRPPPDDYGLAYLQLNRRHVFSFDRLYEEYQKAYRQIFDVGGSFFGGNPHSPHTILEKRRQANETAREQCVARVKQPPTPCPFGAYIVHPANQNCADLRTVRRLQLKYEKEMCRCDLQYLERDLQSYRTFINERMRIVKKFDRKWTLLLEREVRHWRQEIFETNNIYSKTTYKYPWPDQFYGLLQSHYEDLKGFATDTIPSYRETLQDKVAGARSKQQECAEKGRILSEYIKEAYSGPIKCAEVTGKTTSFKSGLFNMEVFIGTGRSDKLGFKMEVNPPGSVSGGYWSVSDLGSESSGGKIGVGYGPVSGEVWAKSSGDWGVTGSVDIVGVVSIGAGEKSGKALKGVVDKVFKFESKIEGKFDNKKGFSGGASTPSISPTIGYQKKSGPPPAWIRLRGKARKSDPWPFLGPGASPGNSLPNPGCP